MSLNIFCKLSGNNLQQKKKIKIKNYVIVLGFFEQFELRRLNVIYHVPHQLDQHRHVTRDREYPLFFQYTFNHLFARHVCWYFREPISRNVRLFIKKKKNIFDSTTNGLVQKTCCT